MDVDGNDNTPEWGWCRHEGCKEAAFPIWLAGEFPDDPDLLLCPVHIGLYIAEIQQPTLEAHHGRFELQIDEDTGRRYWWGGEDGWKDPTEIGEDGTLTLSADHFAIGTVITLREPFNPERDRP